MLPKIKQLKYAQYWKFDYPKQLLLSNSVLTLGIWKQHF